MSVSNKSSIKLSDSIITNKSGIIRRKHSKEFKFKVALEAVKELKTIAAICKEYAVHESQVNGWKKQLKESGAIIFEDAASSSKVSRESELEAKISKLNEYIGELAIENKFFKKNLNF